MGRQNRRGAYFFMLVSRAMVESLDIAVLSWDMPPLIAVSVVAGAMAAVSAAIPASFFGPHAAITSTAASRRVFFIVAPYMLGFGTAPVTSHVVSHDLPRHAVGHHT